jgi:methanogenic corrinoid protein MtbC1
MSPAGTDNRVDNLTSALITLDRLTVRDMLSPVDKSLHREDAIDILIVPALEEIGRRWEKGDLALSQVYMAGVLIEEMITTLFPEEESTRKQSRIGIVVLEDYHMLGERIVAAHLTGAGYAPIRYGRKEVTEVLALIKKDNIRYLLVSTLMLPSALKIKELTAAVSDDDVKIIVGGAPFRLDPELGDEVGADRVCLTASDAVTAIRELEAGL